MKDDEQVEDEPAEAEHDLSESNYHQELLRVLLIRWLKAYNPDFALTPEVVDILRALFQDLASRPCNDGETDTIKLTVLFSEIERLDPHGKVVEEDVKRRMWEDLDAMSSYNSGDQRIDFDRFCEWVMKWKEANPASVQQIYVSWVEQLVLPTHLLNLDDGVLLTPLEKHSNKRPHTNFSTQRILLHLLRSHDTREITTNDLRNTFEQPSSSFGDYDLEESPSELRTPESDAPEPKQRAVWTVSKSFVAGALSGTIAKSVLAPVDRVKLLFQVNEKQAFTLRNAFRLGQQIYTTDGFHALFRGNLLNIIRVVPYAGVQHSGFDYFRKQFHKYNLKHSDGKTDLELSNTQLMISGSLAGGLSLVLAYPLDILRARYMVQEGAIRYSSIMHAVASMYKKEGARSFTKGLVPSLMGTLPYTGIGFGLNERFKRAVLTFQQRHSSSEDVAMEEVQQLHPFTKFLCAYFAGCIAQTTTYPLDTIRRRMQVDGFTSASHGQALRYTGVLRAAKLIWAQEGWRSLFKGVSVNWLRSPLATGISLTSYDLLKEVLGVERVPR